MRTKKIFIFGFFIFLTVFFTASGFIIKDGGYRVVNNSKFFSGEKVTYLAHYGFINAGEAVITLDDQTYDINGRSCHKVDVRGKTVGLFGLTTKVDDLWRSYIDTKAMVPQKFYRKIKENKYRKTETVKFDQLQGKASVKSKTGDRPQKHKEFKVPHNAQDIVSGYYFLRTINYEGLKEGDVVKIPAFFEDTVYDFGVKYLGRETIKTKLGKRKAIILQPQMPDNELFNGERSVRMWVSDDEYRVPIKIEAEIFIGAIEIEITSYENNKVTWKKK